MADVHVAVISLGILSFQYNIAIRNYQKPIFVHYRCKGVTCLAGVKAAFKLLQALMIPRVQFGVAAAQTSNGSCYFVCFNGGYKYGYVEVDVEVDSCFDCSEGVSKSVQVLLNGIDAVLVLPLINLK